MKVDKSKSITATATAEQRRLLKLNTKLDTKASGDESTPTTNKPARRWEPTSATHGTLWSRKRVEAETSMGRSWIYQALQDGKFPKPVRIGSGRVAWVASEVQQWIADRISERG